MRVAAIFSRSFRGLLPRPALCLVLALTACWLPDRYRADIEISPVMIHTHFAGRLTNLELYRQMRDRPGSGAAAANAKDMSETERELRADPNIKSVKPAGMGTFQVVFDVSHPPRVANDILSILTFEPKGRRLTLKSPKYSQADAEFFRKNYGLQSSGDVCVTTTLRVIRHNADRAPGGGSPCYFWHLDLDNPRAIEIEIELPG